MSIVSLRDLGLSYRDVRVLDSVSLDIEESEIVVLTGLSGSGKTSLLRILSGAIPRVVPGHFRGHVSPEITIVNKRSFYVPQEPWYGVATPYVWSEIASVSGTGGLDDIDYVLERAGLYHLKNRSTYTLSAGETQRLLVLTALLSGKSLLLLDEPTSYLDTRNAALYSEILYKTVRERDLSALVVDHRIDVWRKYAREIYVIEDGRVVRYSESMYKRYHEEFLREIERIEREGRGEHRGCVYFSIRGYRYPGSEKTLLEGVEGRLCRGEIVLVKGESGSGKSTLLRLLIERITSDRYRDVVRLDLEGLDMSSLRRDVLYIPDNPFLFFTEPTVYEELRGDLSLLDLVGVSRERGRVSIKRLSSGERRRVALVSAISRGKRILFIDEPTVGLDPYNKMLYIKTLWSYLDKGYSIVVSSHDPSFEKIADEIVHTG